MSCTEGTIEMVKELSKQRISGFVVHTETGFVVLTSVTDLLPEIDFNAVAELYQAELDAE